MYRMPIGHDPAEEHVTVLEWGHPAADAQMQKALVVFPDGKLLWATLDRIRMTVERVTPVTEHVTRYPPKQDV